MKEKYTLRELIDEQRAVDIQSLNDISFAAYLSINKFITWMIGEKDCSLDDNPFCFSDEYRKTEAVMEAL